MTDIEKPAFTFCPGNFEEYADSAVNYTTIQLPTINATDNSGQQPLINCSGIRDKYYIGEHVVTCIARDGAGNEETCQFSIQVRCEYFIKLCFKSYHYRAYDLLKAPLILTLSAFNSKNERGVPHSKHNKMQLFAV